MFRDEEYTKEQNWMTSGSALLGYIPFVFLHSMLKYNLAYNVSWGFGSMFLYDGFYMTDAEQREAARQFINSWRKGGG